MSVPIHLMAACDPPKTVIHEFHRIFAAFLWGYEGKEQQREVRWMGWDKVCSPVVSGGLGVRRLDHIVASFSAKLWWCFRIGKSLWAKVLKSKYCQKHHPVVVSLRPSTSVIWRRMLRIRDSVEEFIGWFVEDEEVDFFFDTWLPEGSMAEFAPSLGYCPIRNFRRDGRWWMEKLVLAVPMDWVGRIVKHGVQGITEPFWKLEPGGDFTVASAFNLFAGSSNKNPFLSRVWISGLPVKISIFMTRLWWGRLPLSSWLSIIGFNGPFRCCLCEEEEESADHLFGQCRFSSLVWKRFSVGMGIDSYERDWRSRCLHWWALGQSKVGGFVVRIMPFLICWHIWKARNAVFFDNDTVMIEGVVRKISREVLVLLRVRFGSVGNWGSWQEVVDFFWKGRPSFRSIILRWTRPREGRLKLNAFGIVREGRGGGGVIIRDSSGLCIGALALGWSGKGVLEVEVEALVAGLMYCRQWDFSLIDVELNSPGLVRMLGRKEIIPWRLRGLVEEVWRAKIGDVTHMYAEGNGPARGMARIGLEVEGRKEFGHFSVLPAPVRGLLQMDRLNLPAFRFVWC